MLDPRLDLIQTNGGMVTMVKHHCIELFITNVVIAILLAVPFFSISHAEGEKRLLDHIPFTRGSGNVIYVGVDSTYQNINYALENASNGDIIVVQNGTYDYPVTVQSSLSDIVLHGNSSTECKITPDTRASMIISGTNNTIEGFNISIEGDSGIDDSWAMIFPGNEQMIRNNTFHVGGINAAGISFYGYGTTGMVAENNLIYVSGQGCRGIHLEQNTHLNLIEGNTIIITGLASYGIFSELAYHNRYENNTIIGNGTASNGFYIEDQNLAGEPEIVVNSKINTTGLDIGLYNSWVWMINSTFNSTSIAGVLDVWNYLQVQVFDEDGITPLNGADVKIMEDETEVYATEGYGGMDQKTDDHGRIPTLLLTDRSYNMNKLTEKDHTIFVKYKIDREWEENRTGINMSSSHMELFVSEDITAPSVPTGLKADRIGSDNRLNITWDLNDDTLNYSIHTNRSGDWALLRNESHPQNWTIDVDLLEDRWYYYSIQAWDDVGLYSDISDPVGVFLSDMTPPLPPSVEALPEYTNMSDIYLRGQSEEYARVEVIINDLERYNHTADDLGSFNISVTLDEGPNEIKVRGVDQHLNVGDFSHAQTVTRDTVNPEAQAGNDIEVFKEKEVIFNGSSSVDNYGIMNYTWEVLDNGSSVIGILYQQVSSYVFSDPGEYSMRLTVTDLAGNVDSDELRVLVKHWTINITTPKMGQVAEKGDVIIVAGTTEGVPIGSVVLVEYLSFNSSTTVGINGTWAVNVIIPDHDGNITIYVHIAGYTEKVDVFVLREEVNDTDDDDTNVTDDDDTNVTDDDGDTKEDKEGLSVGTIALMSCGIMIFFIILILILVLVLRNKGEDLYDTEEEGGDLEWGDDEG